MKIVMKYTKILTSLLFWSCTWFATAAITDEASTPPRLTILHTNDTHSQFDLSTYGDTEPHGGVIERASMLELFRQQDPDLLYLDAGDFVQGSPYFNIFGGQLEVLCLNQQQLLATTFGNHEFDNGVAALDSILQLAEFPLVSCNYHCEGTALEYRIVPHLIAESHDVKIGITGVTCSPYGLIAERNFEGITYEDPREAVNREAAWLRQEGCDLVIVLSHLGYIAAPQPNHVSVYDTDLAAAVRGVDLIIGGHTHTNIEEGVTCLDLDGHPVVITQTQGKANPIGCVVVQMKEGSPYAECTYSVDSIVCSKLHPEDYDLTGLGQEVNELFTPFKELITAQMEKRLGYAPERLTKGHGQSSLGNFVTDALRIVGQQQSGKLIDVGLMNNGGLRSEFPAGNITIGDLYNVFPFTNVITILEMRGADLEELIHSNAGRGLDAWSGIQVTLFMDGDRRQAKDITVGGQPIDPERIYTLCTIDYLAEGNSGMSALTRAISCQKTSLTIRDAMIGYIQKLDEQGGQVTGPLDDRVIDESEE